MEEKTITPEQIIDDWFHEYCEGRCDREEMKETLIKFAMQIVPSEEEKELYMGENHFDIDNEIGFEDAMTWIHERAVKLLL